MAAFREKLDGWVWVSQVHGVCSSYITDFTRLLVIRWD